MTARTIKFVATVAKWFDKLNGNTYHSVRITRCRDDAIIFCQFQYGYGEHYKQTALMAMLKTGWLNRYKSEDWATKEKVPYVWQNALMFDREHNYPILWNVSEGLKRDCVANGIA